MAIYIIISNSIIAICLAVLLVGIIGALIQNWWLGKIGTKEYKEQHLNKKGVIPSIMLFFPLPFTTYTYIFFRALTSNKPKTYLKRIYSLREKIFNRSLKKKKKKQI